MTDLEILGTAEHTFEDAVDTVVGGAAFAAEPVRRPRATARRARRRGAQVTDELVSQVRETTDNVIAFPERVLHRALRRVRHEARRKDVVGTGARAFLQGVNVPAANAAGFFTRLERETAVPRTARRGRTGGGRSSSTARRTGARRTTTGAGRGGRRGARRA